MRTVKIEPDGKYAFILPDEMGEIEANELNSTLYAWMRSDKPFIVIRGIKLVKVNESKKRTR